MKRARKIKPFIALLMCCICIIQIVPLERAAAQSDGEIYMVSPDVPEEVNAFAKKRVHNYVAMAYEKANGFGVTFENADNLSMGQGFYLYDLNENGLSVVDSIYFPIVQNGNVKLLLNVFYEDGQWRSFFFEGFAKELNEIGQCKMARAVRYNGNIYLVSKNDIQLASGIAGCVDESQKVTELLSAIPIVVDDERVCISESICSVEIDEQVRARVSAPNGFSVNDTYYKVLEMSHCLLDQCDRNGNLENTSLCWASCSASIIRYRSGNRTVIAADVADILGMTYDQKGSAQITWNALDAYGVATTQYKVEKNQADNATEIKHNINNQFPICMSLYSYTLLYGNMGHQVTLIGYKEDNGIMTLMCWNSGTCAIEAVEYEPDDKTYYPYGGVNFYWRHSVLVPYTS